MPATIKSEGRARESSVVSILSGWAQQGVQTFFASQRILLDLAMRQNANIVHAVRERLSDPHHSPARILSEVAEEGISNFIKGQEILLNLGKQQNELLTTGVKERVGDCPRRIAAVELLRRSVETFIHMQEEFLKIAGKSTETWAADVKAGKTYQPQHLADMARASMDNFIKSQKKFLDAVADETVRATSGKPSNGAKKTKKAELSEIARKATESFIEAQKKLVDLVAEQMNANVKAVGKTAELLRPFPFPPLAELTREAVKSYVDAQKSLMDAIVKPNGHAKPHKAQDRPRRPVRGHKRPTPVAATA